MGRPPGPVPLMPTGLTSMLMLWLRCTISQMDVPARQTAPRLREGGGIRTKWKCSSTCWPPNDGMDLALKPSRPCCVFFSSSKI